MFASFCVALAVLSAPPSESDAVKKELAALTGTWEIVYLESEGKEQPLGDLKEFRRIQQGEQIVWKKGDQTIMELQFVINPSATPKAVDSTYTTGENKGKTHHGIYRLAGDDFTMCFGGFDKPRPTEFATTPNSGLIVYKARRLSK